MLNTLTSLTNVTRWSVLQKVRGHPALLHRAPTDCKHTVSGSISLPSRGSFHLSLTVLCAIGHQVVFSLGRWASLFPTRFHVSRGTLDLGSYLCLFAYRIFTFCDRPFQVCSANAPILNAGPQPQLSYPNWFGLFPFRSPLLRKSRFLSTPRGT